MGPEVNGGATRFRAEVLKQASIGRQADLALCHFLGMGFGHSLKIQSLSFPIHKMGLGTSQVVQWESAFQCRARGFNP